MGGNMDGFNPDEHESASFDILPAGTYKAIMTKSEMRDTKAGDGTYLNTQWQIIEGDQSGRVFFHMLTRTNPSAMAVQIGNGQLADICRATGQTAVNDSSELHDKPLYVKLKVTNSKDYGEQNQVTSFKSLSTPIDEPVGAAQPSGAGPSWNRGT